MSLSPTMEEQRAQELERQRIVRQLAYELGQHSKPMWVEMGEDARIEMMDIWQAAHIRERGYPMRPKEPGNE